MAMGLSEKRKTMKARNRKKLLVSVCILGLVVVALIVILPKLLNLDRYRGFITSKIEQAVDGKVSLGHISWGISNGVWLETDRFSITESSIIPVDLDFPHVYAKISILPLLTKRLEVSELRLEGPKARVRLKPSSQGNIQSGQKRIPKATEFVDEVPAGLRLLGAARHALASETSDLKTWGKRLPVEISVEELFIHAGRITLEDMVTLPGNNIERVFTDVEMEATRIQPQETVSFRISLRDAASSGIGPLEAEGVFRGLTQTFIIEKPELKMKVVFPALHAETIKPYLGNDALDRGLDGHLNLEVNYDGDFGDRFHLAGHVDLATITFTDPSLWEKPLPGSESRIQFEAAVDPRDITVDSISLRVGNLSLVSSARIAQWRNKPVIKNAVVTADLALGELPPLIPWKRLGDSAQIIRPILESGGNIVVEELALEEIKPALLYSEPAKILSTLRMTARFSDLSVPPTPNTPKIEGIEGVVQMEEGMTYIRGLKARTLSGERPEVSAKINSDLVFTPDDIQITAFSASILTPQKKTSRSEGFTLEVKGKVENWRRQPVVLMEHLSTSPVFLPSLVPLVPWKKLGDRAEPVRRALLAGGSMTINEISFPAFNLQQPPNTANHFFSQVRAKLGFSNLTVKPNPALPVIEGIGGHVMLDKGVLTATDLMGRMGPFTFPTIKVKATGFGEQIQAAVIIKGAMTVRGTQDVAVEELLRKYRLNSLSGTAHIDMRLHYDQRKSRRWSANGMLEFNKLNAESYPDAIRLRDLQGRIYLKKEKTLDLIVNKLTANINEAPLSLDVKLTRGGTHQMLVQGNVFAKNLDLADVNAFLSNGEELKLTGKVDLDMDFHFPYDDPVQTRLLGALKTHGLGFSLEAFNTMVKDGKTDLAFMGQKVQLKHMSLKINDQQIALKGLWTGSGDLEFKLQIESLHLNVDRLIPVKDRGQKSPESAERGAGSSSGPAPQQPKKANQELPLWAHKIRGDIQVELAQGMYKNKPFQDLRLEAHYERGVFKPYNVAFHLAQGRVQAQGCLDLRDLDRVEFVLSPTITALPLEALAPLLGLEKPPIYGPISVTGRLTGDSMNPEVLLPGLSGTINLEVGSGRLPKINHTSQFFASILSILNITGIFSGALSDTMREQGIPFKAIHSALSVDMGKLTVDHFLFLSNALNVSSQGTIDLLSDEVNMQAALAPLRTVDKVIGIVPILGREAQKLTKIYLSIDGSLSDPKVKKTLAKGVGEVITSAITAPKTFVNSVSSSSEQDEDVFVSTAKESEASLGCRGIEIPRVKNAEGEKGSK
jgi:hypothetical protein